MCTVLLQAITSLWLHSTKYRVFRRHAPWISSTLFLVSANNIYKNFNFICLKNIPYFLASVVHHPQIISKFHDLTFCFITCNYVSTLNVIIIKKKVIDLKVLYKHMKLAGCNIISLNLIFHLSLVVDLKVQSQLATTYTDLLFTAETPANSAKWFRWDLGNGLPIRQTSINTLTYRYALPGM